MKPVICIPSYKRAHSPIFQKLSGLPIDKYVFVRPEEKEIYKEKAQQFKVVSLNNVKNIGETRRNVVKYLYSKGIEWAFVFDDDISKVEQLQQTKTGEWNSKRILTEPSEKPRFETKALKDWFN